MEIELKKLRGPGACRLNKLQCFRMTLKSDCGQSLYQRNSKQNMSYHFNTFEDELSTFFLLPFMFDQLGVRLITLYPVWFPHCVYSVVAMAAPVMPLPPKDWWITCL